MKRVMFIFLVALVWPVGAVGFSCTVMVPLSVSVISASQSPYNTIRPGDTVCIAAGTRGSLEIKNFRGSEGKPITFVNSGGKVRIDAQKNWTAVHLVNNEHIRFTGTGNSSDFYGFEIFNSGVSGAIRVARKTRYVEIDHVEIHDVDGSGISAKTSFSEITDTNGNGSVRDEWTQYGNYFHHNYLHDIGTEAFYVGSNFWADGKDPVLEDVEVSYNRVERTGWDGIQLGSAVKNVKVHHNVVIDSGDLHGTTSKTTDRYGLVINNGVVGDFYNNTIIRSRKSGVFNVGDGNFRLFNNLIVDPGYGANSAWGILWLIGASGKIYNNTIVAKNVSMEAGIRVRDKKTGGVYDNIIAGPAKYGVWEENGPTGVNIYNNLFEKDVTKMFFVNPSGLDFHLKSSAPAVNAGSTSGFAPFDLDDISRPQGAKADIGAYEYVGVVPSSPTPTPTPTPADIKGLLSAYATSQADFDVYIDGKVNSLDFAVSAK